MPMAKLQALVAPGMEPCLETVLEPSHLSSWLAAGEISVTPFLVLHGSIF